MNYVALSVPVVVTPPTTVATKEASLTQVPGWITLPFHKVTTGSAFVPYRSFGQAIVPNSDAAAVVSPADPVKATTISHDADDDTASDVSWSDDSTLDDYSTTTTDTDMDSSSVVSYDDSAGDTRDDDMEWSEREQDDNSVSNWIGRPQPTSTYDGFDDMALEHLNDCLVYDLEACYNYQRPTKRQRTHVDVVIADEYEQELWYAGRRLLSDYDNDDTLSIKFDNDEQDVMSLLIGTAEI